jgi:uncharacterized DUF497 family protein
MKVIFQLQMARCHRYTFRGGSNTCAGLHGMKIRMRSIGARIGYHSRKRAKFSSTAASDGSRRSSSSGRDEILQYGETRSKQLLAVAHTENEELIRIISARDATATERRRYEEGA